MIIIVGPRRRHRHGTEFPSRSRGIGPIVHRPSSAVSEIWMLTAWLIVACSLPGIAVPVAGGGGGTIGSGSAAIVGAMVAAHHGDGPIVPKTGRRHTTSAGGTGRIRDEGAGGGGGVGRAAAGSTTTEEPLSPDDDPQQQPRRRRQTFDYREVRRRVYFPNDGDDLSAIRLGGRRAAEDGGDVDGEEEALHPPVADHSPDWGEAEEGAGGPDDAEAEGENSTAMATSSTETTASPPASQDDESMQQPQEEFGGVEGVVFEHPEIQDGVHRYPWWVQLGVRQDDASTAGAAAGNGNGGGGENTPVVMSANPDTRRSHSAAVLRLPPAPGPEPDGLPPSRQRGRRRRDTEADGGGGAAAEAAKEGGDGGSEGEGGSKPPEVGNEGKGEPPPPDPEGEGEAPMPPSSQFDGSPGGDRDGDEPDARPPPEPTPEEEGAVSGGVLEGGGEYMIVSGGFTDEDWSSFPVYAYDLSSTHSDLTLTTKNVPVDPPHPPAGEWIRLGTGTSADLSKRQHAGEHGRGDGGGWGGQQRKPHDQPDGDNDGDGAQQQRPPWPPGRVGHVTAVSERTGDLFVFGGMMYYDREFHAEDRPVVWRATGIADAVRRSASSSSSSDGGRLLQEEEGGASSDPDSTEERQREEEGGGDGLTWTTIEPKFDDPDPSYASALLTRGEAAGGRWISSGDDDGEDREYLVFYGGLHIKSRDRGGAGANTIRGGGANSGGYSFENLDVPLGDVWAFDLREETFTRLASYPPAGVTAWDATKGVGTTYPIARTAHAASIDGDKLVVYGGMTMSTEVGGWAATSLPQWEMLDDVWAFDLVERRWLGRRDLYPGLARSYHSLVGRGDSLVACGGYRTAETIAGESIAFVFSDTLVSLPNSTRWYKAVSPTGSSEGLPHRLSHSSVMDSVGSMYVWGGRFRTVGQIAPSVWRLDLLHGDGSRATDAVALAPADPDGMDAYEAELQTLHLMVAVMIFMSVLFTTLYGTLRRGVEEAQHGGGDDGGVMNLMAGGGGSGRMTRRGGVRQDVIDSFPVKTFDAAAAEELEEEAAAARSRSSRAEEEGGGHHGHGLADEEEACCAICLLEYEDGDEVRTLPCGHDFHKDCVDSWLWNNTSCPACRHSLSSVVPQQSSSEEEGVDDDDEGVSRAGDVDADEGGGRAAHPSRWFVTDRMPIFLRRPVFSILSEGEEHHGNVPPARRGGDEGIVDDDPADRYVASDLVSTEREREVDRIRPIGGRLGASFGRHMHPPPQARPVMMELVTYNVSSEDPYRL